VRGEEERGRGRGGEGGGRREGRGRGVRGKEERGGEEGGVRSRGQPPIHTRKNRRQRGQLGTLQERGLSIFGGSTVQYCTVLCITALYITYKTVAHSTVHSTMLCCVPEDSPNVGLHRQVHSDDSPDRALHTEIYCTLTLQYCVVQYSSRHTSAVPEGKPDVGLYNQIHSDDSPDRVLNTECTVLNNTVQYSTVLCCAVYQRVVPTLASMTRSTVMTAQIPVSVSQSKGSSRTQMMAATHAARPALAPSAARWGWSRMSSAWARRRRGRKRRRAGRVERGGREGGGRGRVGFLGMPLLGLWVRLWLWRWPVDVAVAVAVTVTYCDCDCDCDWLLLLPIPC